MIKISKQFALWEQQLNTAIQNADDVEIELRNSCELNEMGAMM